MKDERAAHSGNRGTHTPGHRIRPGSLTGATVRAALERIQLLPESLISASARLRQEAQATSRSDQPRGGGFRDARYGTSTRGLSTGGHYLPENRFEWWECGPQVPPTGPVAPGTRGGSDLEGSSFANEFNSPLATVVGGSQPLRHRQSTFVDWSAASEGSTANDVAGLPFLFQSRAGEVTVLTTRAITIDGQRRTLFVARNVLDADDLTSAPGPMTLTFVIPQRAVGVEAGFFDAGTGEPRSGADFRLVARGADGMIIETTGSRLAFRDAIQPDTLTVPMAVTDRNGQIVSVEIHLDPDAARPADALFLGRIWCEALPPAAVWQGIVTTGSPELFVRSQHPNHPDVLARRVLASGSSLTLPFRCDRAVVLPRGFHVASQENQAGDTRGFRIGLDVEPMSTTNPGGSITLAASARWSLRSEEGKESHAALGAVYVSVLAWDSQQVDLFAAGVRPTPGVIVDGRPVTASVPNPSPAAAAAIRDGQDPAQASGLLVAALTMLNMSWPAWTRLDQLKFSVGTAGGGRAVDEDWSPVFGLAPLTQLPPPALAYAGDRVTWSAVFTLGDTDTGHYRGTWADHNDTGIIATGQSLRATEPDRTAFAIRGVGRRGSQPAPYLFTTDDATRARISLPLSADLAVATIGGVVVLPSGCPLRGFDVEARGGHYAGDDVVFLIGGGAETGPANEPIACVPFPRMFGVVRRVNQARERVVTRDALFWWYDGLITVGPDTPGAVRNEGSVSLAITSLSIEGRDDEFSVDIGYRGAALALHDADAQARAGHLWLDPGEAFTVGGRFYTQERSGIGAVSGPDPAIQSRETRLVATMNGSTIRRVSLALRATSALTSAHGFLIPERIYLGRTRLSPPGIHQQSLRNYVLIVSDGQSPLSVHSLRLEPATPGMRLGLREATPSSDRPYIDPNAVYQADPGTSLWFQIDFTPEAIGAFTPALVADTNAGQMRIQVEAHVDP
jgi:hypothetical protein